MNDSKKQKKAIEWERIEIFSRKLERSRHKRTTSAEVLKHQRPQQIRELKVVQNC